MYTKLANFVDRFHWRFLWFGLVTTIPMMLTVFDCLPREGIWKFNVYFSFWFILAFLLARILMGLQCPLYVLEDYLRKLDDPEYVVKHSSFVTRALHQRGFSLRQEAVFVVGTMIASVILATVAVGYLSSVW